MMLSVLRVLPIVLSTEQCVFDSDRLKLLEKEPESAAMKQMLQQHNDDIRAIMRGYIKHLEGYFVLPSALGCQEARWRPRRSLRSGKS